MKNIITRVEPGKIESRSFAIIESEVPEPRIVTGNEWRVVRRMIHTTTDFELLSLARFHPDAVRKGMEALMRGCLIVTDTEMARMGITRGRMDRLGCSVECYMGDPEVKEKAQKESTTRASAAVDHALPRLNRAIYVVGNAPTALLRLLEWIEKGQCNPALIVGTPVGFVNASESKVMLMEQTQVPYITIEGRKGGSALAACVVNQLAEIVLGSGKG
ncbi:MAG: precorrin-8X methylmutase [Deltaproteobacteria bacterium]|nr:precorrin-8X methylmutase [Deltaproteobacteria bacterium]